ncbi:hypothetical protein K435DRAFT_959880 [Dendrothele bispora CBS 962.96]|uniref:Transmembrane protein n=1 Tax=Dendrothele bispora (strain CBS 962.96) TaxID=1314807 RepID=A0A4S8MVV5_DENBC|nr:hypothetical protein K435DRAFT_959880 [Dendrothele bispora CBS 962.96]
MTTGLYFPSVGIQVFICSVYFLGLTAVSHCFSRRFANEDVSSWTSIRQISWPRFLILLVFIDSWCFLFASGVVIFGIGLETSIYTCRSGIFLCIVFYASSKALLYVFLIEKVHVVWSASRQTPRLKSPVYLMGIGTIILYSIVAIVMVVGRVTYIRQEDGICFIGLKFYSSVALLSYDLYITLLLTGLFLWPLLRCNLTNLRIRTVARRTMISSTVALIMSTVNIALLAAYHGNERGWMCLGCCTADIIFNALALFWVTKDAQASTSLHSSQPSDGQILQAKDQFPAVMTPDGIQSPTNSHSTPESMQVKQGFTVVTDHHEFFKFDRSEDGSENIEMKSQNETVIKPIEVMVNTVSERDDESYEDLESLQKGSEAV